MAFTEPQKLDIGNILGITQLILNQQLLTYAEYITSDVETAVAAELTRWSTAGGTFTKFTPTESNKGFNLNANDAKADIRKNIALLLGFDLNQLAGYGGGRMLRG